MDQEWFTFETAGALVVGWEGGPLHQKHVASPDIEERKKDSDKHAISERNESSASSYDDRKTAVTGGKSTKKGYSDALDLAGYERSKTSATGIEIAAALTTGNSSCNMIYNTTFFNIIHTSWFGYNTVI